jgi:hypothetical protein
LEKGILRLIPGPQGTAGVRYGPPVTDFAGYNGFLPEAPECPAGDVQWDVRVTLEREGQFRLAFTHEGSTYMAAIGCGGTDPKVSLLACGCVVAERASHVQPRREFHVAFNNVDQWLALRVDDGPPLAWDYTASESDSPSATSAALSVASSPASFSRVILRRNQCYMPPGFSLSVPADGYFVLGDNAGNSFDSRYWGTLPAQNLLGPAVVITRPVSRFGEFLLFSPSRMEEDR